MNRGEITPMAAKWVEMCSGSKAGSYLRLKDFVNHSTLGLREIKKKKKIPRAGRRAAAGALVPTWFERKLCRLKKKHFQKSK